MKTRITAILLTLVLLAGCAQPPAADEQPAWDYRPVENLRTSMMLLSQMSMGDRYFLPDILEALEERGVPARQIYSANPNISCEELAQAITAHIWAAEIFGRVYVPTATLGDADTFIRQFHQAMEAAYGHPLHSSGRAGGLHFVRRRDGYIAFRQYMWSSPVNDPSAPWPTSAAFRQTVLTGELLSIYLDARLTLEGLAEFDAVAAALLLTIGKDPAIFSGFDPWEDSYLRVTSENIDITLSTHQEDTYTWVGFRRIHHRRVTLVIEPGGLSSAQGAGTAE